MTNKKQDYILTEKGYNKTSVKLFKKYLGRKENGTVTYNELIDAVYLAQRELREFYLPSQSEAVRVLNDIIKRVEEYKTRDV